MYYEIGGESAISRVNERITREHATVTGWGYD